MAIIRRTVFGDLGDGNLGMRCSSRGNDALTASDDGTSITFDSRWTDIVKATVMGIAGEQTVVIGGSTVWRCQVSIPNLGYIPFIEMRKLEGNVCRDDYFSTTYPSGAYPTIISTNPTLLFYGDGSASPLGTQALYAVYPFASPM